MPLVLDSVHCVDQPVVVYHKGLLVAAIWMLPVDHLSPRSPLARLIRKGLNTVGFVYCGFFSKPVHRRLLGSM